ncbi:hypothetical protein [Serinibacter salmoneus]|uniref:Uncharacterized protein n=1 Tax=Serinibacter salmoneus TaxID=556530 RepID=A0A2A9CZ56_9MICO|nr:hypothetical protein [Serinibacter salmoneus]PFG19285.1 hypothetical protein ATL40_0843 [Serinibacter salmoneus]
MPSEWVVVSADEVTPEVHAWAMHDVDASGQVISFRGGEVIHALTGAGEPVLTAFRSLHLETACDAEPAIGVHIDGTYWTELTVPAGAAPVVEDLLAAITSRARGVARLRE